MNERCPTCGGAVLGSPPELSAPERDVLRAFRMRPQIEALRCADLARMTGWPYRKVWLAANKLFLRGYIRRDEKRRVVPVWGALPMRDRAAISPILDAETPDGAQLVWGPPSKWAKRIDRLVRHFGGSFGE